MSAPGSGWYGKIAMQACPSPCTPDCPRRSAECHFEGNCPEYDTWKVDYAETLAAVKRKYNGERGLSNMIVSKRLAPKYRSSTEYHRKFEKLK